MGGVLNAFSYLFFVIVFHAKGLFRFLVSSYLSSLAFFWREEGINCVYGGAAPTEGCVCVRV